MRRRAWLLAGAGAGGALLIGWGSLPPRGRLGRPATWTSADGTAVAVNGWIRIAERGAVQLAMPRCEMGQGVHTALAMLAAEELDVALGAIEPVEAGHDTLYGNVAMFAGHLPLQPEQREPGSEPPTVRAAQWLAAKLARELGLQITGGSSSVADAWDVLRLAAATARAQLLGAASLRWRLPVAELTVEAGVIGHPSGPRGAYAEFAREAAATPPGDVRVKPRGQWRLVGSAAPRIDSAGKSDGSARFGTDVRLPGLLHATVRHAPQIGGSPGAVDARAALRLPGVERVVRLPSYAGSTPALAVVARGTWQALRGAAALDVQWQAPPGGAVSSAAILDALELRAREAAASGEGAVLHRRGDADAALEAAPRRLARLYRAPYLAHATMEPMNCTARVHEGRVELWVPTQAAGPARELAAQVAGVARDAVAVHVTALGGGFGRRLELDVIGQAVRIAMETGGRPVQLLWSREEDLAHDFYRPAAAALLEAGLEPGGRPLALRVTGAGDSALAGWLGRTLPQFASPFDMLDWTGSDGLFDLPYSIEDRRIAHVVTSSGVPVGMWRSVGHSHNAFFAESFVDELAHEARQDPVAFRLGLLEHLPRHAAVLRRAAAAARWGTPAPPGRARGVALHESFGSIVAMVVEASVGADGAARAHRVFCAADVGTVVNPGIVAQQMESAVAFGLSAALYGRIDIDDGRVRQRNFADYRLLGIAAMPAVETHLIESTRAPSGAGEPGLPPVAPALANAWFALTGERRRELPLAG